MARTGAALLGAVVFLTGCTYYNAIYNAERMYEDAERQRRAGRDSVAEVLYNDVIRKAAQGYRREPEGEWADDALFLLGRARLRLGEMREARLALELAGSMADESEGRMRALVYLALVRSETGDPAGAMELVNEALREVDQRTTLAEGHLLRGRILLSSGAGDMGWWDLDRAAEVDSDVRVEAVLERMKWGIHYESESRTAESFTRLLSFSEGGERLDTIVALTRAAARKWGPAATADFLSPADSARWDRQSRGRIRLERARLLHEAGDTASASAQAWAVARGAGASAGEARVLLATWAFESMQDLAEAAAVVGLLLPAGDDERVVPLLDALERLQLYASVGLDEPLAWFAGAEVARDLLGAPRLARGLFVAYADVARDDAWAPKALLAALSVSQAVGDRAWLRGRLEAYSESPYVLAASGAPAAGFEALEEELSVRLSAITSR